MQSPPKVPVDSALLHPPIIPFATPTSLQPSITLKFKASEDEVIRDPYRFQQMWGDHPGHTLVLAYYKEFIFGGFTSFNFAFGPDGNQRGKYQDPTAFIFTLSNPHSFPPTRYMLKPEKCFKQPISTSDPFHAVCFNDLLIGPLNRTTMFIFPNHFTDTTGNGNTTFTGHSSCSVEDYEVYLVTFNA